MSKCSREFRGNSGDRILNSNSLPDRRHVYGPGIDEPIVRIENPGGTPVHYYNHQDALGSVVAVSDETGVVADKYTYGVHGESSSLAGNPYRFTGRRLDPETGLYYYRTRYYSASLGRFMQNDPIGYASGDNLYAYVLNDPINGTDPNGQCPWCIGAAIGGVAGRISGGIAGYHATGTWQGAALGAAGGAAVGGVIGAINPLAVSYAIEAAGGAGAGTASFVAGATTFTSVNAVGGAAGAAAGDVLVYQFAGGSLTNLSTDVRNGAIIGAASGVLEAPFVAVGGGAALGYGAAGDAALSAQSVIFGTTGTIAATCSTDTGCGPTPRK